MKKCKYHCDYGDGENCHYEGESGCVNFESKKKSISEIYIEKNMKNSIPIETVIARIIELYNKAKKEEKEYPTEWAVRKTDEWIHKKSKENKPVRKQTVLSGFVYDDWQDELTEYD